LVGGGELSCKVSDALLERPRRFEASRRKSVDVTYLEDEHPGPSYHVNFDRLATTGFEPEWTLRDGVRDLAAQFTTTDQ